VRVALATCPGFGDHLTLIWVNGFAAPDGAWEPQLEQEAL
jgi:hypothetical protein